MINILVKNAIDSDIAVATDAGDKLFEIIIELLKKREAIELDFKGIDILTTAFLNAAIGQLYSNNTFTSDFLNNHLKLINVQKEDKPLFSMVIRRAKDYFKDKDSFTDSANDAFYGK